MTWRRVASASSRERSSLRRVSIIVLADWARSLSSLPERASTVDLTLALADGVQAVRDRAHIGHDVAQEDLRRACGDDGREEQDARRCPSVLGRDEHDGRSDHQRRQKLAEGEPYAQLEAVAERAHPQSPGVGGVGE